MSEFLNALNDVQRQAASYVDGPLLIVAGPGSGKTRVLTYRIAHLIQSGVAPWEILALTFTNKAAKEMKARIAAVVGDRGARVYAGTFHSLFSKFLRVDAPILGFPANFTIYDSDDSKSAINKIVKDMNLDNKVYAPNKVAGRISFAKSNLLSPMGYAQNAELMEQDRKMAVPMLQEIYKRYMNKLQQSGAMDFDDLLYNFFILLHKHPDVLERYRIRFKHVLVDEFQDTNFLQYAILRKLTKHENKPAFLCAVGDDAQSIYAFRGATIENIFDFQRDYPSLMVFKLEQNYRSTPHIVEAANQIISHNQKQIQKKIWTSHAEGHLIKVIKAVTDQEEAKRIVDLIVEQKNRHHLKNKEIAILYRTNAQSRVFEETLRRFNLAYRVYGGLSFYQRKEVKDLVAYLRVAVNPTDEEAMRRIINYPRRGIGDVLLDKVSAAATANGSSFWDAIQSFAGDSPEARKLAVFIELVKDIQGMVKEDQADKTAQKIYKKSGLREELQGDRTAEGKERLDLVESLLNGVVAFVQQDEVLFENNEDEYAIAADRSLAGYLQNIALVTDADSADPNADVITLMSVHSAKGLEFVSVFVTGLEENLFPSGMALQESDGKGIDEERRLFYVAVTRAEKLLTLSFASSRYQHGSQRYNQPSRFLKEIGPEHLEQTTPLAGGLRTPFDEDDTPTFGPVRSSVTGVKPRVLNSRPAVIIPEGDFHPSSPDQIQVGLEVLHQKFGWGEVLHIEGARDNRVATIEFKGIEEPKRKIMLKFAKLQIKT
jgi:DNA helicase II / ATP-dependent DNA helicase PcrA